MDYGVDSDNFRNYSRVIDYYNDLEDFLISIKPTLSLFEYELEQLYTQYFHYVLNIQEEKFLSNNKDKNFSLFHSVFPHFYTNKNLQPFKDILRPYYQGIDNFISYDDFVALVDVSSLAELEQKIHDTDIISLFKNSLFFTIKNKNQEQKNAFLSDSLVKSKLSGVSYHEIFDSMGHFDQILKDHFIFINKFENKLKSDCFDSGLAFFKDLVEIGFKQYFKNSSFPRFNFLVYEHSKKDLLEALNENRDLSIYHLDFKFSFNQYYFLSQIYQYAPSDLVDKLLEKYPLTSDMIDYFYQNKQLENTAFSKFLLNYQLEKKLPENNRKSFNKI